MGGEEHQVCREEELGGGGDDLTPFYPHKTHRSIVVAACCVAYKDLKADKPKPIGKFLYTWYL